MQFAQPPAFGALDHAGPRLRFRSWEKFAIACVALAITFVGIQLVNPRSAAHFAYYFCLWHAFIVIFHRAEIRHFSFAFVVNSAFIAAYFMLQVAVYPDSYGTTSPLGSWADDSYFYALVADSIPANLEVRDLYFQYTHTFTTFIRSLTVLSIDHPLDVIFFQSGTAAALATFSRRFMFQLSANARLSNRVYVLALVCPFLMMNGGVIFLRDTLSAAILIYSLCCFNSRRPVLALSSMALQALLRPGTAALLLPAYAIIYSKEVGAFLRRFRVAIAIAIGLAVIAALRWFEQAPDLTDLLAGTSEGGAISLLGRDIFEGLTSAPEGNALFLAIQELPFYLKVFLNGLYIFMYPFLSMRYAFPGEEFDLRAVLMNLIVPLYAFWLNAWFISGALSKVRVTQRQKQVVMAVVATFLLIGTYSLQTRHRTILYPLYYFVVAVGLDSATPKIRRIGYVVSGAMVLLQVALLFR